MLTALSVFSYSGRCCQLINDIIRKALKTFRLEKKLYLIRSACINLSLSPQNIGQNVNTRISSKGKREKKNHDSAKPCSTVPSFVCMEK